MQESTLSTITIPPAPGLHPLPIVIVIIAIIGGQDGGETWSADVPAGLGRFDGTLMGPGEGIVLGRHAMAATPSPHKGRIVQCGATGYVG